MAAALLAAANAVPANAQTVLADIGLDGPESARYDETRDEYLIGNLGPRGSGNDGFISRIAPDGRVIALKWIAGGAGGVTLIDPLGILPHGDTLYVADTTAVRMFDRATGAPRKSVEVPGAVRLNDLAIARDGTLYVTDSGSDDAPGALYRIDRAGGVTEFARRDAALERPNGIAVLVDGTVVHGGRGVNLVYRSPAGTILREQTLPAGRFDGIVALADGSLLVASQDGHAVWRVPAAGKPVAIVSDIPIPAAIGFDPKRRTILIPQIRAATLTLVRLQD